MIHDPENTKPMNELYAFVSRDENGNEGIIGAPMPLVTSEERLLTPMKDIAKSVSQMTNKKIALLKFSVREEVEVFE